MVVIAIGIKPRIDFAKEAEINIGLLGGIRVNDRMETNQARIYACGDCAEPVNSTTGKTALQLRWFNARQMGRVAGFNCVGIERIYPGIGVGVVLNVFGTTVASIGELYNDLKGQRIEVLEQECEHFYGRFLIADDTLVGAQFIGRAEEAGVLFSAIRNGYSLKGLPEGFAQFPWYHKLNRYLRS